MDLADIRFLYGFDRWATTKVLDAAAGVDETTWSATNIVAERGLGGSWSISSAPSSAGVIS